MEINASFKPWPLYPLGKSTRYRLNRRIGGPQRRCGCLAEEKNFWAWGESNHNFSVTQPVVPIPNSLPRFLQNRTYTKFGLVRVTKQGEWPYGTVVLNIQRRKEYSNRHLFISDGYTSSGTVSTTTFNTSRTPQERPVPSSSDNHQSPSTDSNPDSYSSSSMSTSIGQNVSYPEVFVDVFLSPRQMST